MHPPSLTRPFSLAIIGNNNSSQGGGWWRCKQSATMRNLFGGKFWRPQPRPLFFAAVSGRWHYVRLTRANLNLLATVSRSTVNFLSKLFVLVYEDMKRMMRNYLWSDLRRQMMQLNTTYLVRAHPIVLGLLWSHVSSKTIICCDIIAKPQVLQWGSSLSLCFVPIQICLDCQSLSFLWRFP